MSTQTSQNWRVAECQEIARVPAGFPVGFALLTAGERQYVAYYDSERRLTVASRTLGSTDWTYQVLPTSVGWDSHNYVTMALDGAGHLHVAGNMHCVPLIYFRTETAGDVSTLRPCGMTGETENRCTYPHFMRDADDRLIFHYRDGGSGRGNEIYNVYNETTQTWRRLLDIPLTDGQGRMNAYMNGPTRGPDGLFHLIWVWRDDPDCATNHHLSYARSVDLRHWESAFGQPVELPLVLEDEALWVDPIPSGGGIINGCHKLYFDCQNRPILSYHKSDADGHMQIYAARAEEGQWRRYPLTDWGEAIHFDGRGSMGFIGIQISGLSRPQPGVLTMTYRHRDHGSGRLFIDEATLTPLDQPVEIPADFPPEMQVLHSDFPDMSIRRAGDLGSRGDPTTRHLLQWETLPANNDKPRDPPLPDPSVLRLYTLTH